MPDDDPCIDIQLTNGRLRKTFQIREGPVGWTYTSTARGLQLVVCRDRATALARRAELDTEVAQLIAEGWTPRP